MSSEDQKAEYVSRAKLSEQAERYDDMAEFMRLVTESGIGKSVHRSLIEKIPFSFFFVNSRAPRRLGRPVHVLRIPGHSFFL